MNEFCERFRLSRLSSWLGFDQNFSILAILFFKKRLNFFFSTRNTPLSTCTKYKRERKNLSSLCERLKERRDTSRRRKISTSETSGDREDGFEGTRERRTKFGVHVWRFPLTRRMMISRWIIIIRYKKKKRDFYTKKGAKRKRTQQRECDVCEKVFDRPSGLVRRVRIHTNERPYKNVRCVLR